MMLLSKKLLIIFFVFELILILKSLAKISLNFFCLTKKLEAFLRPFRSREGKCYANQLNNFETSNIRKRLISFCFGNTIFYVDKFTI